MTKREICRSVCSKVSREVDPLDVESQLCVAKLDLRRNVVQLAPKSKQSNRVVEERHSRCDVGRGNRVAD